MADNTQIDRGSLTGDIIATDEIAGVKYQRMKLTIGADGVNDGDLSSTNPMPVSGTVDVGSLPAIPHDPLTATDIVTVDNFPASYPINDNGGTITVDGTVDVTGVATSANQVTTNNQLAILNAFTPSIYDNIILSYTGPLLTGVVFKLAAVTVSTLTLGYDGSNQLITVVKS